LVPEDDDYIWASLLALDPGGTTGWSVMQVHPQALVDPEVRILDNIAHFSQGQIYGGEIDQELELLDLLDLWPNTPVMIERFVLRKFLKSEELLSPVRITAVVEFFVANGHVGKFAPRPYAKQQPADAMRTATDERLKEWGFYRADGNEHARDATRHAITAFRNAKNQSTGKLRRHLWPQLYGPAGAWAVGGGG
jgi:hypothetical protein